MRRRYRHRLLHECRPLYRGRVPYRCWLPSKRCLLGRCEVLHGSVLLLLRGASGRTLRLDEAILIRRTIRVILTLLGAVAVQGQSLCTEEDFRQWDCRFGRLRLGHTRHVFHCSKRFNKRLPEEVDVVTAVLGCREWLCHNVNYCKISINRSVLSRLLENEGGTWGQRIYLERILIVGNLSDLKRGSECIHTVLEEILSKLGCVVVEGLLVESREVLPFKDLRNGA